MSTESLATNRASSDVKANVSFQLFSDATGEPVWRINPIPFTIRSH
ncbi:MAG: hypothetical protein QOD67_4445 [Caballeronia sp.]|jgi:hypothetical protein|nr:hypothetical protein [Caballeronia sp.]